MKQAELSHDILVTIANPLGAVLFEQLLYLANIAMANVQVLELILKVS